MTRNRTDGYFEGTAPAPIASWLAGLALVTAMAAAAPAWSDTGTVPGYGLGSQNTQYVQGGSQETSLDLPWGFKPILHLRTYYFDMESLTDKQSVAWALGGWAGMTTGFLGNVFQLGVIGYTSQRLYGPENKGGTRLLAPPQEPITVLGEAFGAIKLFDQTFVGYRQLVNRPFVNQADYRMVPNVMEGYTLRGSPSGWSYVAGYLTKIKVRDSESYRWMSQQAGAQSQEGMAFAGVTIPFGKGGFVRLDEQYVKNAFNTIYVDGLYPIAYDADTNIALGIQFYPQRSVNAQQLGNFSTWGLGLTAVVTWKDLTAQVAYTQTGIGSATLNPYGDHPSYLNLMQVAFNSAGEKAWLIGATYDFGKLLTPGLSSGFNFAHGSSRVDSNNGSALPNRHETDVRADYVFPFPKDHFLHGLSATVRYSWLHQDGAPQTATQFRAYINYEVAFR